MDLKTAIKHYRTEAGDEYQTARQNAIDPPARRVAAERL